MHRLAGMPSMRWDVKGYFLLICYFWGSFLSQATGTAVGDAGDISYRAGWENCFRSLGLLKPIETKNLTKVKHYYEAFNRDLLCANGDYVIEVDSEAEQVQCEAPPVDPTPGQEAANIQYSGVTNTGGPIFAAFEKHFPLPPRAEVKITELSGSGVEPQSVLCTSFTRIYELAGSGCEARLVRPMFVDDDDVILHRMNAGMKLDTDLWHSFRVDTECNVRKSGKSKIKARVRIGGPHKVILPEIRLLLFYQKKPCRGDVDLVCPSSTLEGAKDCIRKWISLCDHGEVGFNLRTYPGETNRYTSKSCANSMHRVFDLRGDADAAAEVGFKLPLEQQIGQFFPNLDVSDACTKENLGLYLSDFGCGQDPKGEHIATGVDHNQVHAASSQAPMSSKRYLHLVSNDKNCHIHTTGNDPEHTAEVYMKAGTKGFGLTLDNGHDGSGPGSDKGDGRLAQSGAGSARRSISSSSTFPLTVAAAYLVVGALFCRT